jgi:hypothetical protein
MIELTKEQVEAMAAQETPLELLNPRTRETFFLIRKDVYQLVCNIVSVPNRNGWDDDDLSIPPRNRRPA